MIIFTVICALMFFLSAVILFMPKFRKYPFFKPFGVYMAYQGIWTLISYPVNQIFPTNQVMAVLNYLGSFIFCGYFLFVFYASNKKSGRNSGVERSRKTRVKEEKREEPVKRQPRYRDDDVKTPSASGRRKNRFAEDAKEPASIITEGAEEKVSPAKKKNRFEENSSGSSKYSLSGKDDIYQEDDIYDDMDDIEEDIDDEDDELENVEITDDDLDYFDDDEEEDDGEDIDIYDELEDDDEEEEDKDEDDDDLLNYIDDEYFDDEEEEEDEEDDSLPPLKGTRYRE